MSRRRVRSFLLVPVTLAVLLAGCGGSGSGSEGKSDEAKPYVDAMATSMAEEKDSPFDEEQSRCFSERLVDVVGIDKVKAAGTPEDFAGKGDDLEFDHLDISREQGEEIYANFDECGVDLRETMMAEMAEDDTVDAETKACLDEAVTEERLEDFFVTIMVEGEERAEESEGGNELVGEMMSCMLAGMGEGSPDE